MGDLLERFLKIAENETEALSVEALLTKEERVEWEILVKAFDSIDIMNVGECLKKVTKIYQLERWQEMAILAYVKILELMIKRAKEVGALDLMKSQLPPPTSGDKQIEYDGSMFG
jgi:hypothetical protein|tara:strand:+ start:853 stop:1197 length:345 start_codon:yes stop_codon:yes gene_type:complete